jgi:hypothetical protein
MVAQANALSEFSAAALMSYRNRLKCRRQSDCTTFQSNSGLPHSCPVSEKASGGTPETCAGAPAAANSRASVLVPWRKGSVAESLVEDRATGAGFQHDRDASTDIGFQELTCQLEQMLAGPHICRLRTHIDGHVAHDVDPVCICICLQIAVVMTEICRSPHRQDMAQDPDICGSATELGAAACKDAADACLDGAPLLVEDILLCYKQLDGFPVLLSRCCHSLRVPANLV